MRDAADTTFTRLSGAFSLAEDPGIYVYPMAGIVGEANRSAVASFALSRASSTDVTATYEFTSGTATQGVDFEGSTARLRSAQERCVLQHRSCQSDSEDSEGNETFTASVSSVNGSTSVVSIAVIDSEEIAVNSVALEAVGEKTVCERQ